ncbi:MAG TPA: sugar ABC transporter permease [Mycobacterium sp.]|nr:sugar ABC transporter permease [Mycobacterium sp.]
MDGTSVVQSNSGAAVQALPGPQRRSHFWRGTLQGSEYTWALAFVIPYIGIFLAFVLYPVLFGLWMGNPFYKDFYLYRQLFDDPIYRMTVVNTLLYLVIDVNLEIGLAFILSGFFMRKGWWNKALLMIWVLPWAIPAVPIYISMHWMLNGEYGFINSALWSFFHINGPDWLTSRWLAFASMVASHLWKNTPFWTVIFLAGRMAIPPEIRDAAKVDGCTGIRSFFHITIPMLANLYLVATLLLTIWLLGDFTTPYFITGGGPAMQTYVLANLGIRDAFDIAQPRVGVAAVMSALPLVIPLVVVLMRKLRSAQVEL